MSVDELLKTAIAKHKRFGKIVEVRGWRPKEGCN
jgi:hypothetical protein